MEQPGDWFWKTLESTKPSLRELESALMNATADELEQFIEDYELAASLLCDYWDGPIVDGIPYSEDDTEDLCNWIVAQGESFWSNVQSGELSLYEVAALHATGDCKHLANELVRWSTDVAHSAHVGYQAPWCIAHAVRNARFGEDDD